MASTTTTLVINGNTAQGTATIAGNDTVTFVVPGGRKLGKTRVNASGTWDSGTLTMKEPLNNGASFATCTDSGGSNITFTANGAKQVYDKNNGPWGSIQGVMSGAGASVSVVVEVVAELI